MGRSRTRYLAARFSTPPIAVALWINCVSGGGSQSVSTVVSFPPGSVEKGSNLRVAVFTCKPVDLTPSSFKSYAQPGRSP